VKLLFALVAAASVGSLIACGSGTSADVPSAGVVAANTRNPEPKADEVEVYEADNAFFRDTRQVMVLKVRAGESVRFKNKDGLPHSLYSASESNPFDLGVLNRFESRRVTFDRHGDVEVRCQIHPEMLLLVEVQ
jgi:plastocyanin